MSKNVKQNFETLAIGVICAIFVLSMNKSCSGVAERFSNKKIDEKTEIKKVQELKRDTVNNLKLEQKVR